MKKLFTYILIPLAVACGHSVQKSEIAATTDPADAIRQLEREIATARTSHTDVLASDDFKRSQTLLTKAKKDLQNSDSQSTILDTVAYGKGYLNRAEETARQRRAGFDGVLKTRDLAIDAGARNHPTHNQAIEEIDDDLRDETNQASTISAKDISKLQSRYLDLELAVLKSTHLDQARAKIESAKYDSQAKKYAPRGLRQAEVDLASAESMISANRSKPENFKASVDKANESAELLLNVASEARKSSVSEDTASGIVLQKRKISGLQNQLSTSRSELRNRDSELSAQNKNLFDANKAIGIQAAIESARQQFTKDEAEVYQQGDKLLIRLKTLNFSSGRSDLPEKSLELLAKVKDVAGDLNPKQVMVEGHTDSLGTKTINERLSKARAESVAKYFETSGLGINVESVGYGFEKPIADNKSSNGRSQNRRVDVIVTPETEETLAE